MNLNIFDFATDMWLWTFYKRGEIFSSLFDWPAFSYQGLEGLIKKSSFSKVQTIWCIRNAQDTSFVSNFRKIVSIVERSEFLQQIVL